jgi:hypothetical protein
MRSQEQFYLVARSSIKSTPVESEYRTEAEAIEEAIRLLKQGQMVEFGKEIAIGF